jgi:hypothetical protein
MGKTSLEGRLKDLLSCKLGHLQLLLLSLNSYRVRLMRSLLGRMSVGSKGRSKIGIVHGDRNTKYFHSWAKHRKKVNSISNIMDGEGRIWRKKGEISKEFLKYYKELFTTQSPSGVEDCLLTVNGCVTDEMNNTLLQPFISEEVLAALHSMHPLKYPGPDGI